MDERVFRASVGRPIPAWDLRHRLPCVGYVGPEIRDSGVVYRCNSTYLDITDQPHMMRQWLSGAIVVAVFSGVTFTLPPIGVMYFSPESRLWQTGDTIASLCFFVVSLCFILIAIWLNRDEFFALARRPIRFNKVTKKIYAMRHRRKDGKDIGDVVWEVPWDDTAIFCVHKGPAKFDLEEHYHIRCYQLDDKGCVQRAFAIGRDWEGPEGMRHLLAQWNYLCMYMNNGPAQLPLPMLYLSEYETASESFLYCMYQLGLSMSGDLRLMFMPLILLLTCLRLLSIWTCRQPVWPNAVLDVSLVIKDDPYDQPSGHTPIGWGATARARRDGRYPLDPHGLIGKWGGLQDAGEHALCWTQDVLPPMACQGAQKFMTTQ